MYYHTLTFVECVPVPPPVPLCSVPLCRRFSQYVEHTSHSPQSTRPITAIPTPVGTPTIRARCCCKGSSVVVVRVGVAAGVAVKRSMVEERSRVGEGVISGWAEAREHHQPTTIIILHFKAH